MGEEVVVNGNKDRRDSTEEISRAGRILTECLRIEFDSENEKRKKFDLVWQAH